MCTPANMRQHTHTQMLAHIPSHIYHQAQNSLSFNSALPLTLNNWTRCNTTSIARPRYSYTSHWAEGALTYSGDRINIQFPTSHYNSIKANLLLPLEHCFGWMLSGGPTPLWAQLRTFKHIKISQALHCPDYCLNIICFYISLSASLTHFSSKIISISDDFFPLEGIQGRASKYLYLSCEDIELPSGEWTLPVSHFLTRILPLQSATHCTGHQPHARRLTPFNVHPHPLALLFPLAISLDEDI